MAAVFSLRGSRFVFRSERFVFVVSAQEVAQHTDFATHTSVASHCVNMEYGVLPPRMRLIPLTHGAFGPEATRFLSDLGKRSGGGVPVSLLDSATWAVPAALRPVHPHGCGARGEARAR